MPTAGLKAKSPFADAYPGKRRWCPRTKGESPIECTGLIPRKQDDPPRFLRIDRSNMPTSLLTAISDSASPHHRQLCLSRDDLLSCRRISSRIGNEYSNGKLPSVRHCNKPYVIGRMRPRCPHPRSRTCEPRSFLWADRPEGASSEPQAAHSSSSSVCSAVSGE